VPAGHTRNGLPVSAQFAARPFAEGLLIRVAAAHERALQASASTSAERPPK
jgi:Asp-tRNA(Asn)/Glu-tRNA(Gln) amidotransferase A subunit family amidase